MHWNDRDRARFESKVDRTGDCHLWTGSKFAQGYGVFGLGGKIVRAHRLAYEIAHGEGSTDGWHVLHDCAPGPDRTDCVNPAHLRLGTPAENSADARRKGQLPTGARNGHATHPDSWPSGDRYWTPARRGRDLSGARNGRAKLTDEAVREIRSRLAAGEAKEQLMHRFGISRPTLNRIARRAAWTHVP